MFAVIKTGGKQYLVLAGDKLKIEKIEPPASAKATAGKEEEKEITFKEVLLLEKNRKLEIGTPFIKGAKVIGKILKQGKAKKVIIFKYKAKKRYRKKTGHRQSFTEIEITKIES